MADTKYRCPGCGRNDGLFEKVVVPGWRSVDEELNPIDGSTHRDVEWSNVYSEDRYGCGECEWEGDMDDLQSLGIDGEPLPLVHQDQLTIG